MKKRPLSAVGYKRPISQYARVAMAKGTHPRYRVELPIKLLSIPKMIQKLNAQAINHLSNQSKEGHLNLLKTKSECRDNRNGGVWFCSHTPMCINVILVLSSDDPILILV